MKLKNIKLNYILTIAGHRLQVVVGSLLLQTRWHSHGISLTPRAKWPATGLLSCTRRAAREEISGTSI